MLAPMSAFGIQTAENYTVDMGHHHIHVRRHIMPTHKHHRLDKCSSLALVLLWFWNILEFN